MIKRKNFYETIFGKPEPAEQEQNEVIRKAVSNLNNASQISDINDQDWIVVPQSFSRLNYQFSFSPARLSYCPGVEEVSEGLGLQLENTSKDSLDREFIGNIKWFNALRTARALGSQVIGLSEIRTASELLYRGMKSEIPVYDNSGKQINTKFLEQIFNDIYKVQAPWRAEWIDADFKKIGNSDNLELRYNHLFDASGEISGYDSKPIGSDALTENKQISLADYLLSSYTPQGFPKLGTPKGNYHYFAPLLDNKSVAGLGADSDRADLGCFRYPDDGGSNLGVRLTRRSE